MFLRAALSLSSGKGKVCYCIEMLGKASPYYLLVQYYFKLSGDRTCRFNISSAKSHVKYDRRMLDKILYETDRNNIPQKLL
jgi:hypothetical protein